MGMDIGFVVSYLVIPIILAISLVIGKKKKKHFELAIVYGFKGMFYWYSALMNFISFFNQTWSEKYVVGFAIGLAILEGTNGMLECYEECLKNAREKQNIKPYEVKRNCFAESYLLEYYWSNRVQGW